MFTTRRIKMRGCLLAAVFAVMSHDANADIFDVLNAIGKALNDDQPIISQSASASSSSWSTDYDKGPGGIKASCNQMQLTVMTDYVDRFNVNISNWTPEMLTFLKDKLDTCIANKMETMSADDTQLSKTQLADMAERTKRIFDEKYNRAHAEPLPTPKDTRNECLDSPPHDLYRAQQTIIDAQYWLTELRAARDREKLISQESGVRNLAKERSIGESIVRYKEISDAYFKRYKQLGGKALSAETVTSQLPEPCPKGVN